MDEKPPFDRVAKQEKARKTAEESRKNWELYQQDNQRIAENTARLRALRLAKEAADAKAAAAVAAAPPTAVRAKVAASSKVTAPPKATARPKVATTKVAAGRKVASPKKVVAPKKRAGR
jgi:hypothetical protein